MDLLTRTELEDLVTAAQGPHVSLFMPTHRAGKETEGDPIRWKNLLSRVETTLEERGMRRREIQELFAPAWELHGDAAAWQHMSDGFAAFVRAGEMRTYRLPIELPELAAVGDRFLVTPVLPMLGDEQFLVLTISQKEVRLLQGSRSRIEELHVPEVPGSFDEVFEPDEGADRAAAGPSSPGQTGPATFYGSGGGGDNDSGDEDLLEFFREVAEGVHRHVHHRSLPMVLAGLPESIAVYREANQYPHVLEDAVERNPDDLRAEELHELVWPIIEKRLAAREEEAVGRLQQLRGTGRGITGADAVLGAAQEGRVETLLLTRDGCWAGGTDSEVVRLDDDEVDECELLEAAAVATLSTSGEVRVLEELPEGERVAAVLRY